MLLRLSVWVNISMNERSTLHELKIFFSVACNIYFHSGSVCFSVSLIFRNVPA